MAIEFLEFSFLESSETVRLPTARAVIDEIFADAIWGGKIVWSSSWTEPNNGLLTIAPLPTSACLGRF